MSEGKRAELIHDQIYMITPPSRIHQAYVNELSYVINNYMKKNNHPCKIYPAPFVVFLNKDKMTYVEPDISVICDSNKLTKKGVCRSS